MKSNKVTLIIGLIFLIVGCGQHSSTEEETVLFEIDEPNYEATFATYNDRSSGSADGPTLMQRRGDLQFVLQDLYPEKQVNIEGEVSNSSKYELEIRWQDSTDADVAKQAVRSRIQQSLEFSTRLDTVEQVNYTLSVADKAKLRQAAGKIPEDVMYKSKLENNNWDVIATLPRMAQELAEKINHPVQTKIEDDTQYSFELTISDDISEIIPQLEDKYGLTLDATPQPLERIIIPAANN